MALLREMSQTHVIHFAIVRTFVFTVQLKLNSGSCSSSKLSKNCLFCYYMHNLMGEEFTEAVILNLLFQLVSFSVRRSEL